MQTVSIKQVKPNPRNPRIIRDEKFKKLVKSIQDFPDMLNKRPLVVFTDTDGSYVVLGGNMRLKAMNELKFKEVPVIIADEWTEEQKAEFLVKDNVGFGEWDWEMLANDWDSDQLSEWGLDIPVFGHEINQSLSEDDLDMTEEFDPIGTSSGLQRVVFIFDGPEEAESYLESLHVEYKKMNMAWQVNLSTQSM